MDIELEGIEAGGDVGRQPWEEVMRTWHQEC